MPETLAQKQERFLEQTLAPDQVLDAAGQAARGIVQPAALKPVLFEEGARLESPAITADRRVFIGAHSYMNGQGYLRSNVFIGRLQHWPARDHRCRGTQDDGPLDQSAAERRTHASPL